LSFFLNQLVIGIQLGSQYVMVALGLTLIFGILDISHFAHGHLYMIGAYMLYIVMVLGGINYWVAFIICMAALALAGMVVERVVYRPLRGQPHINTFIAAIGLILMLETLVRGIQPQALSVPKPIDTTLQFAGISMEAQRLIVIVGAIVLIILLQLFIKRTRLGTAIEAVAQDRDGPAGLHLSRDGERAHPQGLRHRGHRRPGKHEGGHRRGVSPGDHRGHGHRLYLLGLQGRLRLRGAHHNTGDKAHRPLPGEGLTVKKITKPAIYVLLLGLAAAFPWLKAIGIDKYQMRVMTLAMAWAIATLSLNLILGYTGQASASWPRG